PYAGGNSLIYRDWADYLPSTVEVIALELPGRASRLKDPPFASVRALVEALPDVVLPLLDVPFCFFGHSMGALIAFELARRLGSGFNCSPSKLFVSGRRSPRIPKKDPVTYNLPRAEFIEELKRLEGVPKEVLAHDELLELVIPLLRSDFRMTETYEYVEALPLRCPMTAFGGVQDDE